MRLDKFLVENQIGSRSEVKNYIKKGLVTKNGQLAKKPEEQINEAEDCICFKGQEIKYEPFVYYILHKPAGVITATEDKKQKTVLDLLKDENRKDLFPVGRLDKDTEGLLLITNDGALAHNLLSPKKHVPKTYYAKVSGEVTEKEVQLFSEGLDIGDEKQTLPAKLKILACHTEEKISEIELTITEGRFHQVKRMFQAVGMEVVYLKRITMGNLVLDDTLPKGSYQKISIEQIQNIQAERKI